MQHIFAKKAIEMPHMNTLFFIPIRKGSKGIPGKNMKILGGKPLIAWVLNAIIASNAADEIWVATDDESKKNPNDCPLIKQDLEGYLWNHYLYKTKNNKNVSETDWPSDFF